MPGDSRVLMKMKTFNVLWVWIFLSAEFGASDEIKIYGYSGKHIIISCSYNWASTNIKYFCRDPCGYRDILVKSDRMRSPEGRYTLEDFGNGSFTVNITDLQESDTGIYWCGVQRVGIDTYLKVNLTVSEGKNDSISTMYFNLFCMIFIFIFPHIDPNESITTSAQTQKEETQTPLDLHTTTPAAHSEAPSTTASTDALKLSPSITGDDFINLKGLVLSVHPSQYAGAGLVTAVILFVVGVVTVYQYRKRVKTSESCASATPVNRNNKCRDEEGAQNSTEMKSKDKTEVTKIQSDSVSEFKLGPTE
ncbi:CMRF35-like molecule 1 [Megalobrama amblycephala]|uniref:CMRF35-like molecule 1 n=1 Tax=Megalobrama amblycephala TaxID=75352 RepID=UPI0020145746|nr:CMRF35-like molecule 1 [Megalobrama amblycephala]